MKTYRLGAIAILPIVVALAVLIGPAPTNLPAFAVGGDRTGGKTPPGSNTVETKINKPGNTGSTSKSQPPAKPLTPEQLAALQRARELARRQAETEYQRCMVRVPAGEGRIPEIIKCSKILEEATGQPPPGVVDPGTVAREVVARLTLPAATPVFGPDPKINQIQPGTLVIGYPYWLTVPGDTTLTTTATAQGLTLTMTATRAQVVFEMGDGTTKVCTQLQPWPGAPRAYGPNREPLDSPVCGHRYTKPGTVQIRATTYWEVRWNGGGQSGIIPVMFTDTISLPVIEVSSVQR